MVPVLACFERVAGSLSNPARPLTLMEKKQLDEVEKGIATLRSNMCAGLVNDHVQSKLLEMASAYDSSALHDVQRIQVGLTSTDWNDW